VVVGHILGVLDAKAASIFRLGHFLNIFPLVFSATNVREKYFVP
jgi:hypothetical protein